MPGNKTTLALLLILLAVLVWFYYPWLSGQADFYLSDTCYFFEPIIRYTVDQIKAGRSPFWNTLAYQGMSQIAIQNPGFFYPLNCIFLFFTFSKALALIQIIHQLLAWIGMYLLCRQMQISRWGSGISATIYALNGYMFSLITNFEIIVAAACIPWIFYAILLANSIKADDLHRETGRFPSKQTKKTFHVYIIVLMLSLYLQITSGRPELYFLFLLISGVFIAYKFYALKLFRQGKSILFDSTIAIYLASPVLIACLLAMPMVIPAYEWSKLSVRSAGLPLDQVFLWSANWYDLLSMVVAHPFGDLSLSGNRLLPVACSRGGFIPYVGSTYVGAIAVLFALLGLFDNKFPHRRWLVIFFLGSLIFVLGNGTFVMPFIFKNIPILAMFRYPIKMFILLIFAISIFAGRGLDFVTESDTENKDVSLNKDVALKAVFIIWAAVFAITAIMYMCPNLLALLPQSCFHGYINIQLLANAQQHIVNATGISLLFAFLTLLIIYRHKVGKLKTIDLQAIVFSGILASLIVTAFKYCYHPVAYGFYQVESRIVQYFKERSGRCLTLYNDPLGCPVWYKNMPAKSFYVKANQNYANVHQYGREMLLGFTFLDQQIASPFGYEGSEQGSYKNLLRYLQGGLVSQSRDIPVARFCQLSTTNNVLTQIKNKYFKDGTVPVLNPKAFKLLKEDIRMNCRVYEVFDCLPHYYFAKSLRKIDKQSEAFDTILQSDKNGFDPHEVSLVEEDPQFVFQKRTSAEDSYAQEFLGKLLKDGGGNSIGDGNGAEEIVLNFDRNSQKEYAVNAYKDRLLVICDQYYPGWYARIDDKPVPMYRVNGYHLGLPITAGKHKVSLHYEPKSLEYGIFLAKAAAVIFLLVMLI